MSFCLTACEPTPGPEPECTHENCGELVTAKPATCNAEGNVAYYQCADCNVYLDENKAVIESVTISADATKHKYVNAVCSVCNYNATNDLVDYVSKVQFNPGSGRVYAEAELKTHIDGDTSHFYVNGLPERVAPGGVFKARYLAVNTPESTGRIEDYGKTASRFTKEKLTNAYKIMVESNTNEWEIDSTGSRVTSWVWYKTDANSPWRNLNVEILQNGLALASNTRNNCYGEDAFAALNQAKTYKLAVYSGIADPEVPSGDVISVTLRELRTNTDLYEGARVAFEGVVTLDSDQSVYIEEYDSETDMYYGMVVYYGFGAKGEVLEILTVGNRVRVVGVVQYWETGGTYQVTDLRHNPMKPNSPNNLSLISSGHEGAFQKVTGAQFNGNVDVPILNHETGEEETKTIKFGEASMNTTISMDNLVVTYIYTTNNGGDSDGAMTITCKTPDGQTVTLRTVVLLDENGNRLTEDDFYGKTINVKGLVEYFSGKYQIKIVDAKHITVVE